MKCQKCNHTVTRKSKFCPHCGSPIVPRSSSRKRPATSRPYLAYAIVFGLLGLLLGVVITKFSEADQQPAPGHNHPLDIQSAAVLDIAKEFHCFCGTCDDRLDVCDCTHPKGAEEVKGFIAQKLQEGHKKKHIVEMVQQAYGLAGLDLKQLPPLDAPPPPLPGTVQKD